MDQDAFFSTTDAELGDVDMNAAPTSGEEYLKQVIVARKRVPNVVVAEYLLNRYSTTESSNRNVEMDDGISSRKPPEWWCNKQCADFSDLRQKLRRFKARAKKAGTLPLKGLTFPPLNKELAWRTFCYSKCMTKNLADADKVKAVHQGTPPFVTVVLSMDMAHVVDALEFNAAWFGDDEEYEEARAQWLFALMCVVEKPLQAEVCSALRDIAKKCGQMKRKMGADGESKVGRMCDWFICIVVHYFGQKDLTDV